MKTIKDMPEHSRPREKLREKGASALTDEELVAAILGMGTAGVDVRTIARQVAGLIREHKTGLTLDHLQAVPGVGLAKAGQILSAFELARRHLLKDTVKITVAQDVLPLVADIAGKQQDPAPAAASAGRAPRHRCRSTACRRTPTPVRARPP